MPMLSLLTNQPLDHQHSMDVATSLSSTVATLLGKPESYVMVRCEGGAALTFAGNSEPAAYIELKSLGLPGDQTATLSGAICHAVEALIDVPAARVYIEFAAPERSWWGWNGATF